MYEKLQFSGKEDLATLRSRLNLILPNTRLSTVVELCIAAHEGQTRRGGAPYATHPLRVALSLANRLPNGAFGFDREELAIIGASHDVLEDSPEFTSNLQKLLSLDEYHVVTQMSKSDTLTRKQYWSQVAGSPVASLIKTDDRIDNLRFIHRVDDKDWRSRYLVFSALEVLPLATDTGRLELEALIRKQTYRI